jgi:hypothetical protein
MLLDLSNRLFSVLALSIAIGGCLQPQGGGQSGHDRDPDGGETSGGNCTEDVIVLDGPDAATSLGFAASDVLAYAQGSVSAPLHWLPTEGVTYGPESGESSIAFEVSYAGGEVRFVDAKPKESSNDGGEDLAYGGDACPDRIEIDVSVTITTAGGALAETFTAPLRAVDARYATLAASFEPGELAGAFAATPTDGSTVDSIDIDAGFSAGGTYGGIHGTMSLDAPEGVVGVGFVQYARWPSEKGCEDPGGIVVPTEGSFFDFSASDVLELANGSVPGALHWKDGSESTIALALSTTADIACARVGSDFEPEAGLSFEGRLVATSADGRIDADLPVRVDALADESGALVEVRLFIDAFMLNGVAPQDFESEVGVSTQADLGGFDEVTVQLDATFVPGETAGVAHGSLTVLGLTIPDCIENPPPADENGAPGCEGTDITEVDEVTW